MARVAVVEDDVTVAEAVAFVLTRAGHEVDVYPDGAQAAEVLLRAPPDLLVLDLMLPGLDGLEVCRRFRRYHPHPPIMMLTARAEEVDRIVGLESGADDYLVKPFSLREMEARVKALLRRASLPASGDPIHCGAFSLDPAKGRLRCGERLVSLSPRESQVLAVLMQAHGQPVSRASLLERVWGPDFMGEGKTVDVHIRWLRLKLEEDPAAPRHLLTFRRRGYCFSP